MKFIKTNRTNKVLQESDSKDAHNREKVLRTSNLPLDLQRLVESNMNAIKSWCKTRQITLIDDSQTKQGRKGLKKAKKQAFKFKSRLKFETDDLFKEGNYLEEYAEEMEPEDEYDEELETPEDEYDNEDEFDEDEEETGHRGMKEVLGAQFRAETNMTSDDDFNVDEERGEELLDESIDTFETRRKPKNMGMKEVLKRLISESDDNFDDYDKDEDYNRDFEDEERTGHRGMKEVLGGKMRKRDRMFSEHLRREGLFWKFDKDYLKQLEDELKEKRAESTKGEDGDKAAQSLEGVPTFHSSHCPNCGGQLEWNPSRQGMQCPYCDSRFRELKKEFLENYPNDDDDYDDDYLGAREEDEGGYLRYKEKVARRKNLANRARYSHREFPNKPNRQNMWKETSDDIDIEKRVKKPVNKLVRRLEKIHNREHMNFLTEAEEKAKDEEKRVNKSEKLRMEAIRLNKLADKYDEYNSYVKYKKEQKLKTESKQNKTKSRGSKFERLLKENKKQKTPEREDFKFW